jgi:putative transposase
VQALGRAPVRKYAELEAKIQSIYDQHHGRYGYRRITVALREAGDAVNHKLVQRLMTEMGLKSLVREKKDVSGRPGTAFGEAEANLLDRNFRADKPNEKWATGVTEFEMDGAKLFLSAIIDLYNGEIVAHQTSHRGSLDMVQATLGKAFARLNSGDTPMLHSDQSWHYRRADYKRLLAEHGVTQSMSRPGTCLDNAVMESFFAVVKTEYFYLGQFASMEEVECGLDDYIHYYNHERIKLRLDGLSPVEYRIREFGD